MSAADTGVTTPVRWGEVEAARLTPPAVADPRGRAMVETVAALLRETPLTAFLLTDPWTVDARALPALLAAAGVSDLIEPGLPEAHARAILVAARQINAERGRVVAIRRALASVGLTARITLWYQTTPKGEPNTYVIDIPVEEQIIPEDGGPIINAATLRQARRLVEATKRWSQGGTVRLGTMSAAGAALVGAAAMAAVLTIDCIVPSDVAVAAPAALVGTGAVAAVVTVDCVVAPLVPAFEATAFVTAFVSPAIGILGMPGIDVDVEVEDAGGGVIASAALALGNDGRGVPDLGVLPLGAYTIRARSRSGAATSGWASASLSVVSLGILSTEDELSLATDAGEILIVEAGDA